MDDYSRSEYIRQLLSKQKNQIQNNGNSIVNPSIEQAASMQTNMQTVKQSSKLVTSTSKTKNVLNEINAYANELATRIVGGFLGGVEGVFDLGATALGSITGNEKFTDWAERDIANPLTEALHYYNNKLTGTVNLIKNNDSIGEIFKNSVYQFKDYADIISGNSSKDFRSMNKESTPNEVYDAKNGVDEFVLSGAQSIGNMLPAIATGGAVTKAAGASKIGFIAGNAQKIGKVANLTVFGINAAGAGAQEALQQGYNADLALAYGAATGAIEVGTEYLGDAIGMGDKIISNFFKKGGIAKTGIKSLIKGGIGEGIEEILSDVFNPILSDRILNGKTFKEAWNEDLWTKEWFKQAALDGLAGFTTSIVMSGTSKIANLNKISDPDIQEILSANEENQKELLKIDASNLTQEEKSEKAILINNYISQNLQNLENRIQNMSESKRSSIMENLKTGENQYLGGLLNEDGKLTEYAKTLGMVENDSIKLINRTIGSIHQENEIKKMLDKEGLKQYTKTDLSNNEQYKNMTKYLNGLCEKTGVRASVVVVNDGKKIKGFVNKNKGYCSQGNIIYLAKSQLNSTAWQETINHELTHITENTSQYKNVVRTLEKYRSDRLNEVASNIANSKGYFTKSESIDLLKAIDSRNEKSLTNQQLRNIVKLQTETNAVVNSEALKDAKFADKMIKLGSNNALAKMLANIQTITSGKESKQIINTFNNALKEYNLMYENGKIVAMSDKDKIEVQHNLETLNDDNLNEVRNIAKKNGVENIDGIIDSVKSLASWWESITKDSPTIDEWNKRKPINRGHDTFIDQMGYKYNHELELMCAKGIPLFEAINKMVEQEIFTNNNIELDQKTKQALYYVLARNYLLVPCGICFVEEGRRREMTIINKFMHGGNSKVGYEQFLTRAEKYVSKRVGYDFKFDSYDNTLYEETYETTQQNYTDEESKALTDFIVQYSNEEIVKANAYKKKQFEKGKNKSYDPMPPMESDMSNISDIFSKSPNNNLILAKIAIYEQKSLKHIKPSYLMHSQVTTNLSRYNPAFFSLFNQQGGVSGYKVRVAAEIYDHDALRKDFKKSRNEGGIRSFSNSDFEISHLVDWMQYYLDLTAKKEYSQNYTKVLAHPKLFGLSNIKTNLSCIPETFVMYSSNGKVDNEMTNKFAGITYNNEMSFSDKEGIDHREAIMLHRDEQYGKSCGAIMIGSSIEQGWRILENEDISFGIGFHAKSNDPKKRFYGAEHFSNFQNAHFNEAMKDGKKVEKGIKKYSQYLMDAEKLVKDGIKTELTLAIYSEPKKYTIYDDKGLPHTLTEHGRKIGERKIATAKYNDIPKIAAQLYLNDCYKIEATPAYQTYVGSEFYFKWLADFTVYDAKGNYAPHQPVNLNIPDKVPYLDKDGNKQYVSTKDYIKKEVNNYSSNIDSLSKLLADNTIQSQLLAITENKNFKKSKKERAVMEDMTTEERLYAREVRAKEIQQELNNKSIKNTLKINKNSDTQYSKDYENSSNNVTGLEEQKSIYDKTKKKLYSFSETNTNLNENDYKYVNALNKKDKKIARKIIDEQFKKIGYATNALFANENIIESNIDSKNGIVYIVDKAESKTSNRYYVKTANQLEIDAKGKDVNNIMYKTSIGKDTKELLNVLNEENRNLVVEKINDNKYKINGDEYSSYDSTEKIESKLEDIFKKYIVEDNSKGYKEKIVKNGRFTLSALDIATSFSHKNASNKFDLVRYLNSFADKETSMSIQEISEYEKDNGVDSIVFTNVKNSNGVENIVSILNRDAIKNANLVQYDGNGKLMSLSERLGITNENTAIEEKTNTEETQQEETQQEETQQEETQTDTVEKTEEVKTEETEKVVEKEENKSEENPSVDQTNNKNNSNQKKEKNKTKSNKAKSNIPSFDALKTSYVEWHKDEILYISKAEDLVKQIKGAIEATLERELGVKVESTFKIGKTAEKLFDAKNFNEGTIDDIINEIVTSEYIVHIDKNNKQRFVITDLNEETFKNKFRKVLNEYIELNSKETKKAKTQALLEKWKGLETELRLRAKQIETRLKLVRQYEKRKYTIPQEFNLNLQFTDDNIANHSASFLMQPLLNIYFQGSNYNSKGLKDGLNQILDKYQIDKWDDFYFADNDNGIIDPVIPFNKDLRDQLEELRDSIPEPTEITMKDGSKALRYSGLSNESLARVINCIDYINKLYKEETRKELKEFKPDAIQSSRAINKKWANRKITKWFRKAYNRFFKDIASAYAPIRMLLGKSKLSDMITIAMPEAMNKSKLYNGDIKTNVSNKIKELKVNKKLGKKYEIKSFTPKGDVYKLTGDELVYLYLTLNTEENFNAVENSGLVMKGDVEQTLIASGQAENAKEWINKNLDDGLKEYANFIKDLMNNRIQKDYISYYRERYGKETNEIKDYWTLLRKYDKATSIEKAIYSAEMFSSERARTKNDLPVLLASATRVVDSYSRKLGNQKFVLPVYREIIRLLNTKVDDTSRRTLKHDLSKTIGDNNYEYIKNVLDEMVGKKDATYYGWLKGLTSGYTMKLLSFNMGTALKQYASLWTSNLPIRKSTKGLITRIFNNNAKFKKEYQELTQEIGSIKYRNYGGVVEGEGVSVIGTLQKPAEIGMKPVTLNDYFTITTGMCTLMVIAKENGFEYGTKANKDFVKEHYNEFIISQIASDPLALNEIARGKGAFGQLSKFLFGYMQGANRVAVASQMNKLQIYNDCRKVDIEEVNKTKAMAEENINELEKTLQKLEEELDDFILELQDDGYSISQLKQSDEYREMLKGIEKVRNKIILAQAELSECDVTIREYKEYEIMGGKWIPVNMAGGLLAQGIFVTLVNELMRHMKGKKDWDDWEFINDLPSFLAELAMNTLVGWIPVVNSLVNKLVEGYDIEVANAVFLNDILTIGESIYTNAKNIASGDTIDGRDILESCVTAVSDITGLPIETLYGYVNGTVRMFDPETAIQSRNLFYGTTYNGQLNQYKSAIEKGNNKTSQRILNTIMDSFKVDATTSVKTEINTLYSKGYTNALPKSSMTSYNNENGESVKLNSSQQTIFKNYYNKSKDDASKLLNNSAYRKLTDENKAKALKKLYDAYYDYAKAKTLGTSAETKLGNLLLYTNGKADIYKYVSYIGEISEITAKGNKTRKEMVTSYVNKLKLTTQEKLLLMQLCGYSANDKNKNILKSYLKKLGMSSKDVEQFL